jgi:hypothetical protein
MTIISLQKLQKKNLFQKVLHLLTKENSILEATGLGAMVTEEMEMWGKQHGHDINPKHFRFWLSN